MYLNILVESAGSSVSNNACDFTIGQWSLQDGNTPLEVDNVTPDLQWSSVTTLEEEDQQLASDPRKSSLERVVTVDQWKSCSICLEELADPELLVHKTCGATFCHCCLEVSGSCFLKNLNLRFSSNPFSTQIPTNQIT